jgi:hypothetical protein
MGLMMASGVRSRMLPTLLITGHAAREEEDGQ